jgi:hypothetical protein
MADGKLLAYYWEIFTALAEAADLLDVAHPDYSFPSEDEVENTAALYATLIFKDGSRLIVRSLLEVTTEIREHDYAYIYLDAGGNRIFQHDDAPHHPNLSTHPHHMHKGQRPDQGPDKALPLDIPRVDFVTILSKVVERVARR